MEVRKGYDKIVGTGGIGMGMLFHSTEMSTLGRSESRLVTLSNAKDYCKQHIVLHYAAVLLKDSVSIYPIGYVGSDTSGNKLIGELKDDGMDIRYVGQTEEWPTMLSICLQYPDKEGFNFTAINNAAVKVTPDYVLSCMEEIGIDKRTIVAAIPEVSLESRVAMLRYGKEHGAYCVLSVPVTEATGFLVKEVYKYCDLLAVNEEEAQAILGSKHTGDELAVRLYEMLSKYNPGLAILITCGMRGAYSIVEAHLEKIPPLSSKTVNTTGAGDAFLGGTIAGIAMQLKLQKGIDDKWFGASKLTTATELGTICAGMAVESEDSIAFHVTTGSILERITQEGWETELWDIR